MNETNYMALGPVIEKVEGERAYLEHKCTKLKKKLQSLNGITLFDWEEETGLNDGAHTIDITFRPISVKTFLSIEGILIRFNENIYKTTHSDNVAIFEDMNTSLIIHLEDEHAYVILGEINTFAYDRDHFILTRKRAEKLIVHIDNHKHA